MTYENIFPATFLSRPNRFVAEIELEGRRDICHVKNTGRCRELLTPGADIWVQKVHSPTRRTEYDLITVRKGDMLVNIDSAAPNRVFAQWVEGSGYFGETARIRPETVHGDSRFDFYIESGERRIFVEVKGVTLEHSGVAAFPDAPTERGVKHLHGLKRCVGEGFEAFAVFILQMDGMRYMIPNRDTHPEFAAALAEAKAAGVRLMALGCAVTESTIAVKDFVEVRL